MADPPARPRPALSMISSQDGPGDGYTDSLSAAEHQDIPMVPNRPEPRRLASSATFPAAKNAPISRYVNMLLGLEKIPVGRFSILVSVFALILLLLETTQQDSGILHVDPLGGLRGIPRDFYELAE